MIILLTALIVVLGLALILLILFLLYEKRSAQDSANYWNEKFKGLQLIYIRLMDQKSVKNWTLEQVYEYCKAHEDEVGCEGCPFQLSEEESEKNPEGCSLAWSPFIWNGEVKGWVKEEADVKEDS